eukprot:2332008-Rhodomonas_salina.1
MFWNSFLRGSISHRRMNGLSVTPPPLLVSFGFSAACQVNAVLVASVASVVRVLVCACVPRSTDFCTAASSLSQSRGPSPRCPACGRTRSRGRPRSGCARGRSC